MASMKSLICETSVLYIANDKRKDTVYCRYATMSTCTLTNHSSHTEIIKIKYDFILIQINNSQKLFYAIMTKLFTNKESGINKVSVW